MSSITAASSAMRDTPASSRRAIGLWLVVTAVMVFAMMLIGAITRLTESGLSMVEWRVLVGTLPPFSDAEWQRVFELYQTTPEFRFENPSMTLAEFKTIFWWEYVHRLWGRLIGLVYAVPFFWFLASRRIPAGYRRHLWTLLLLGGLQGVIGWWMVKSGLVVGTDVSQYRLAVHLAMAFFILGYLVWLALALLWPVETRRIPPSPAQRRMGAASVVVIFITVISGALVAGLNAGLAYNEWPLMGGRFVPQGYADLSPWWLNPFDNMIAVQFDHRLMAYLAATVVFATWLTIRHGRPARRVGLAADAMGIAVIVQIGLGISTLLLFVPLPLAVLHQAGAALLFCSSIWLLFELRRFRSFEL